MKQQLVDLSRKLYLLSLLEFSNCICSILKNYRANKKFLRENPSFVPPPLALSYDAYAHTNLQTYLNTGYTHAEFFSQLIKQFCGTKSLSILDFGCGPARLLRHMNDLLPGNTFFASDYNIRTINWCRRHIKNVEFTINGLNPPLSFASNYFDVVYSLSVFTHLSSSNQLNWLNELKRVLKPEGVALITLHGDYYRDKLLPREKINFDLNNVVIRDKVFEGKRSFSAFHPPEYVRSKLFRDWTIVKHIPAPITHHLAQDIWIIRNTES